MCEHGARIGRVVYNILMLKSFYDAKIEDVFESLKTSKGGLSSKEAEERLKRYGQNILPKKKKDGAIKIFFREFLDPLILLLFVAIVASIIAGEYLDAVVIFGIILADAIMGAYQENRANKTAEALEKLIHVNTTTLRNRNALPLDAELLVPGDIVMLESGDKIPADLRLIEVHNFSVDESILTGESVAVVKDAATLDSGIDSLSDRINLAYSGTTVVSGRATAVVVKTGQDTELGKIADSLNNTIDEKSPLSLRISKLSRQITIMVVVVALVTAGLLITKRVTYTEILITVIAFAVSAMPEGLPLALTMALTIASNRMAKQNVIVRKLKAAESLGSCTVIASDKTGTLTMNQQTAKKILLPNGTEYEVTGSGYDLNGEVKGDLKSYAEEIGLLGALNNEAVINKNDLSGDSIDLAFLVLGEKLGIKKDDIKILERIPYESENKYSAVFYEQDEKCYCTVKGSLEVVADFCTKVNFSSRKDIKKLQVQNDKLASDGYRVIALAKGEVEKKKKYGIKDIEKLCFMGMVGFIDPIREEAATSIASCKKAGIKVLMVTGDHPLTALSIAKDLGLAKTEAEVATNADVDAALERGEHYFDDYVGEKTVFARVTPLQKLVIIESLKRQGEFVAVTGDGVNDAPALKSANIGVAMGSGTDIARDAADMIIRDDNFKSIVSGIKEGRIAYSNIRKIMFFLLSCGMSEAVFFCMSIFMNLPMPLTAVQFLWLNIVTDGLQDLALSFERGEKDVLSEKPRSPKESIFDKALLSRIAISTIFMSLITLVAWILLLNFFNFSPIQARGYIMCLIVFMQNLHVLNCRSEKSSLFAVPLLRNPIVPLAIIGNIALQFVVMEFAPLSKLLDASSIPFGHILCLFAIALIILPVVEISKNILARLEKK